MKTVNVMLGQQEFGGEERNASGLDAAVQRLNQRVTKVPTEAIQAQLSAIISTMTEVLEKSQATSSVAVVHMDVSIGFDSKGELGILGSNISRASSTSIVIRVAPKTDPNSLPIQT